MAKKLSYEAREKMVDLSGACFWYWNGYWSFLRTAGVPQQLLDRYPQSTFNKYDVMRNVLNDLDAAGRHSIIENLASEFFRLRGPRDPDILDVPKAKRLLTEFRELVGDDPIERAVQDLEREKAKAAYKTDVSAKRHKAAQLDALNQEFIRLTAGTDVTPIQRGFALERLFFELLEHSEVECTRPYRTDAGEQIDGHFRYEKFDYLVEAKWTDAPTRQDTLAVFDAKIRGKAQSTRGLCLSANGFDPNAIDKFSGDAPRILLFTGDDLALVLNGSFSLTDALRAKVDAIVRKGEIHLSLRQALR